MVTFPESCHLVYKKERRKKLAANLFPSFLGYFFSNGLCLLAISGCHNNANFINRMAETKEGNASKSIHTNEYSKYLVDFGFKDI